MKIFSQINLINLLLITGMIILVACGIIAYQQVQQIVTTNQWVVHTHKVIEASNSALLNLTDAESRLSFYVLTNDKTTTQEIPKLIAVVQQNLTLLTQLTKDNVIQKLRVDELKPLVNSKIAFIQQLIQVDNIKNNPTLLRQATGTDRRKLKEQIIQQFAELNQEEKNLLEQRNNTALRELKRSNLTFFIFETLSQLFIIMSLLLLNYNYHKRNIAERKRDEAEKKLLLSNKRLKVSEERYLLATEGSSVGLWDWEVGTDQIFYSSYYKKMLGYSNDEFPNELQSFEKIIHPGDHDRLWQLVNKHLEIRTPFKIEYRLRTKSGEYNWFQAAGLALWNEADVPTRMAGSIIDIGNRKKAEQRLSIQHAVAEILSEALSLDEVSLNIINAICKELGWEFGAIWLVDSEKNLLRCSGIWHEPSPLLSLFGDETRKELIPYGVDFPGHIWKVGKPTWFSNIEKDQEFPRAKLAKKIGLNSAFGFPIKVNKKIISVIECFTTEKQALDKDILDLMATIGAQIGHFITRRMAENNLRKSEAYKTAVLESATDSIITINDQNKIMSFNQQTTKEFQYAGEELKNQNIEKLLPDYTLNIARLAEKPSIETIGIRKDEKSFPVEIKMSKMNIDSQNMLVIIIRDITERKRLDVIKNEFVSVVSHELRTPLTSIRGALGLVISGTAGTFPEKVKKLLDLANNNCERLLLLINDILDIEKLEAGKMNFEYEVLNLKKIVIEAMRANNLYAEKYSVTLKLTDSDARLEVKADPDRLMQVLTNLISNAVKFSPMGESVNLSITQHENYARVLISNKGPGISTEFQSRIFQRFSQADTSNTRDKGGTGLGLNISKSIIEKMGGTLNFISKPNEITTFYFDLPICQETSQVIPAQPNKESLPNQDRILICEDDEDQATYLGKLLDSAGFQIDISHSVAEAKEFLAKNAYDILLLDLILPDQDGISFIRELRSAEQTRTLPIIVLSLIAETGRTLLNGEAFSVSNWLEKPIDFDRLMQAINHIKKRTHPNMPHVLHVEDDPETFDIVRTLLERHATVISAPTIHDAEDKIKHEKFDLVILDLLLPDGNSEQLLPLLAKHKLPVIVYSSFKLADSHKSEVRHVLLKSETSKDELVDLIKEVLETTS